MDIGCEHVPQVAFLYRSQGMRRKGCREEYATILRKRMIFAREWPRCVCGSEGARFGEQRMGNLRKKRVADVFIWSVVNEPRFLPYL